MADKEKPAAKPIRKGEMPDAGPEKKEALIRPKKRTGCVTGWVTKKERQAVKGGK